jgi:hypothetical protein
MYTNRHFLSVKWPSGTYGLPQPQIGCPDDTELTWKTGWTYHDTEDDNPANQRSAISHMAGNFTQHGIQQRFCIKDSAAGGSEFWPEGKYCMYKKGASSSFSATNTKVRLRFSCGPRSIKDDS